MLHSWVEVRLEGISAELLLLLHWLVVAEGVHSSSSAKRIGRSSSSIHIGPERIACTSVISKWVCGLLTSEWVVHLCAIGSWHGSSIVHHVWLLHHVHVAAEWVGLESWLLLLLWYLLLLLLRRAGLERVDHVAALVGAAVVHEVEVACSWV